jgi:hypothetical protein
MKFYPIRYHWTDRMGSSYMATSVASGKTPEDARRRFLEDHPHLLLAEIIGPKADSRKQKAEIQP